MAERFAIAATEGSATLDVLGTIERFAHAKLRFVGDGVEVLDWEGEPMVLPRSEFVRGLADGSELNFQLWISDCEDILVSVRRVGSCVALFLGLEGLDPVDRDSVRSGLEALFRDGKLIAFAFDPDGCSVDVDWLGIFADAGREIVVCDGVEICIPVLIGLAQGTQRRIEFSVERVDIETLPTGGILVQRRGP